MTYSYGWYLFIFFKNCNEINAHNVLFWISKKLIILLYSKGSRSVDSPCQGGLDMWRNPVHRRGQQARAGGATWGWRRCKFIYSIFKNIFKCFSWYEFAIGNTDCKGQGTNEESWNLGRSAWSFTIELYARAWDFV